MNISNSLLSDFAKTTKTDIPKEKEYTMYGTVDSVDLQGNILVIFDGSDVTTPVESSVVVKKDDRVIVSVKDRHPVVTSNLTTKVITAATIEADEARISNLEANSVTTTQLNTTTANITQAYIQQIGAAENRVAQAYITKLDAESIYATKLVVEGKASVTELNAVKGNITTLQAEKITAAQGKQLLIDGNQIISNDFTARDNYKMRSSYTSGDRVIITDTRHWSSSATIMGHTFTAHTDALLINPSCNYSDGVYICASNSTTTAAVTILGVLGSFVQNTSTTPGMTTNGNIYCLRCIEGSDRRMKHDIKDTSVKSALDEVSKMKHRSYVWNDTDKEVSLGYIAQELEEIDPEFVSEYDGKLGIDTMRIVATATKAIQELSEKVNKLERRIEELETEHNQLPSEK